MTTIPKITITTVSPTMRLIMLDGVKAGSFSYESRDVMKGMGVWGKEKSWTGAVTFDGQRLSIGVTEGVRKMASKVEATISRYLAAK